MALTIPPEVAAKLDEFLSAGKSGTVELEVKSGRILEVKTTERTRVSTPPPRQ